MSPDTAILSLNQFCRNIWHLRVAQNNEQALRSYSHLKKIVPERILDMTDANLANLVADERSLLSDFLPIKSSMGRLLGSAPAEHREILLRHESSLRHAGEKPTFLLMFEIGLSYYAGGEYEKAIEFFYNAEIYALDPTEKLCALANAVFCLDNLGLNAQNTIADMDRLGRPPHNVPQALASQIESFHMRLAFRNGQFSDVFSNPIENKITQVTQAHYFRFWLACLPYHIFRTESSDAYQQFARINDPHFRYKNYRSRTLAGLIHSDDAQSNIKCSEIVDRLYLWVWRWLAEANSISLSKILQTLNQIDLSAKSLPITHEDTVLLENALAWLCLFDACSEPALEQYFRSRRNTSGPFALLDFERQIIHYLRARRDGEHELATDILCILQTHDLWNSDEILLSDIVKSLISGNPPQNPFSLHIFNKLSSLLNLSAPSSDTKRKLFEIDIDALKITNLETNTHLISDEGTKALQLLLTSGAVGQEYFCSYCFGIDTFQPDIHAPKISNLLYRLRPLLGGRITLRMRAGKVMMDGNIDLFQIKKTDPTSSILRQSPIWNKLFLNNSISIDPNDSLLLALDRHYIKRRDIEKATGKSRATVNRLMKEWEDLGMIEREGQARGIKYRVQPKLKEKVIRGEVFL